MQFQVPQFIEVEDKVFGPFTVRQFIYMGGAVGAVFILYTQLPLWLTILFGAPIVALGAGLAFYKVNNQPLINIVEAAFTYFTKNRLYIWHKEQKKVKAKKKEEEASDDALFVPKLSDSKLKDLAWSLDIQESIYSDQNQQK